ncbi:hypothetical protein BJ944DRAFT_268042 [Cunninghamella echinulata]|nr:hypothetical protein BJ944DRAFT_268042 [Cunninghamella echinulata]
MNDYQLKENYEKDIRSSSSFHDQTHLHQVYINNPYSSSHENYYHQEQQPKLSTSMKNGPSPSSSSFPYEPSLASENSKAYSNDTPHTNYFDLFGSNSKSFMSPQPHQQQQQGNEKWSGSLLIGSSSLPGYFDQRPTNYHTQQHLPLEKNNIATTNAINIPSHHHHYHTTTATTSNIAMNNNENNNNNNNNNNNTIMNNNNNNYVFRLGDHYTQGGSFTQNSSFKQPSEQSFILGSSSIDLSQPQQQHHRDYTTLKTTTPPTPSITTVGTSTTSTPLNDDNDPFYMEDTDIIHHHDQQRLEDLGYIPSYSSLIRPTS